MSPTFEPRGVEITPLTQVNIAFQTTIHLHSNPSHKCLKMRRLTFTCRLGISQFSGSLWLRYSCRSLHTHTQVEHTHTCYKFLDQVLDGCIKQKKKREREGGGGVISKKGKGRCKNTARRKFTMKTAWGGEGGRRQGEIRGRRRKKN